MSGGTKPKRLKWPPTGVLGKRALSPLIEQGEDNWSRFCFPVHGRDGTYHPALARTAATPTNKYQDSAFARYNMSQRDSAVNAGESWMLQKQKFPTMLVRVTGGFRCERLGRLLLRRPKWCKSKVMFDLPRRRFSQTSALTYAVAEYIGLIQATRVFQSINNTRNDSIIV